MRVSPIQKKFHSFVVSTAVIAFFVLPLAACSTTPATNETDREIAATRTAAEAGRVNCPFDNYDPKWESKLLIYHFYVGQGDATFIRTPAGTTVLIDGGPVGAGTARMLPVFHACKISSVDYGVVTHAHIDHFGGWVDLLKTNFSINKAFYIPSLYDDTGRSDAGKWGAFLAGLGNLAKTKKFKINPPTLGQKSIVDEGKAVYFNVVAFAGITPKGLNAKTYKAPNKFRDANAASIAQVIAYGKFYYWAGGDLTGGGYGDKDGKPDIESDVAPYVPNVDVFHSNHHGSDTSNNETLLNALSPTFAVISIGRGGTNGNNALAGQKGDSPFAFHLPNIGALTRMAKAGVKAIYVTSKGETEEIVDGKPRAIDITKDPRVGTAVVDTESNDIMLVSDGTKYWFYGNNIKGKFNGPFPTSKKK